MGDTTEVNDAGLRHLAGAHDTAATTLAARTRATGTKVRAAAGSYTDTDEGSAAHIAIIGQTVRV